MGARADAANRPRETGNEGRRAQAAAASRLALALTLLALVLVGIFLYSKNIKNIVPLGLPVTVLFGVGFFFVMKYLGGNAPAVDREGNAEPGTGSK